MDRIRMEIYHSFPRLSEKIMQIVPCGYGIFELYTYDEEVIAYDSYSGGIRKIFVGSNPVVMDPQKMKIDFSYRLLNIMEHNRCNQNRLAEITQIQQPQISRYCNRHDPTLPSLYSAIKIALALNCKVDDLTYMNGQIRSIEEMYDLDDGSLSACKSFNVNLQQEIIHSGLRKIDISNMMETDNSYISHVLSTERLPDFNKARSLGIILNCGIDRLVAKVRR